MSFGAPNAAAIGLLIAALALVPGVATADPTPSLALEPIPAGDRGFAVERAAVDGHLLFSTRLAVDYAREPLVLRPNEVSADVVVADQAWVHALGTLSLLRRFQVNVDLPLVLLESGDPAPAGPAVAPRPGDGVALGDIRLGGRLKLLGSSPESPLDPRADVGLTTSVWLPTDTGEYAGDGSVRIRGGLVADGSTRRLFFAFNAGIRTRPAERLPGQLPTRVGTALGSGLALGFYADGDRHLAIGTEATADLTVADDAKLFDPRATVGHLLLTSHYRIRGGPFELGAAFGPGLAQGAGSPAWRALVQLGYSPEQVAPPPDRDEDQIPDREDACVDLRGVPSRDPILNGCPEPSSDRDGDAIPDDHDACPLVAGEPTGEIRTHGCPPIVDADGDHVPDATDACPDVPGVGPPDGDGCPKPPDPVPKTELVEAQITLSQQVQFETGTAVLRPESDQVLGEVLQVFVDHPELELVEVQGHTDETGTDDLNRRLGQDRADQVVRWLVDRGVARERLVAKGYGSDRPLVNEDTDEARAKNRRVEFRVLRTTAPAPTVPPPGGAP